VNYYAIGLPALLLAIVLLLWWLWYLERLRRLFPERLRGWMDREGLTQAEAAKVIGKYLGKEENKPFDPRMIRRWLSGEGPNLPTVLRMQRLLNGAPYTQMEQTLDDGTKSYAAMVRIDEELTPNDLERLVYESHERSYKKGLISEENWRAYQKNYDALYTPNGQKQPTRKRSRSRKKRHSK